MPTSNFREIACVEAVLEITALSFTATANTVDLVEDSVLIANHGLKTGDIVSVYSAGATQPTGLSAATRYFAIYITEDKIAFATTLANAVAGTKVNLTATGSGTVNVYKNGFGSIDSGVILPKGAIVCRAIGSALTALSAATGAGAATLAINAGSVAVKAATAENDAAFTGVDLHLDGSAPSRLTASGAISFVIAADSLSAGKYAVMVEYIQSE